LNFYTYLTDPDYVEMFAPGIIAGIAIAVMCAVLSPLVVLKRMAFVGQGISHAAFGGIGIASLLGAIGGIAAIAASSTGQFIIVLIFCLAAGLLIAALTQRGATQADTAIGIVLVGSMTLGAVLLALVAPAGRVAWEAILFGSIFEVGWTESVIAWIVAAGILLIATATRRTMLFWAFDETAAPAFGVAASAMKYLLVVLLTLVIVTAMKLAGVVLATALLILPGAAALRLSDRGTAVMGWSAAIALVGMLGGLLLSFEVAIGGNRGLPPGAAIVAVLVALFAAANIAESVKNRAASRVPG
jgi:ABC-type Mn2+/Zn2+ transport system permease subunit